MDNGFVMGGCERLTGRKIVLMDESPGDDRGFSGTGRWYHLLQC